MTGIRFSMDLYYRLCGRVATVDGRESQVIREVVDILEVFEFRQLGSGVTYSVGSVPRTP